jgi:uncharacterized protein YuzE
MIRTNYDPEADVLHVQFGPKEARYDGAEEVAPGVFVEFDSEGNPIGLEVISVRPARRFSSRLRNSAHA